MTTTPKTTCPLCAGSRKNYNGSKDCPECKGSGLATNHFVLAGPGRSETAEESAAAEGTTVEEQLQSAASARKFINELN